MSTRRKKKVVHTGKDKDIPKHRAKDTCARWYEYDTPYNAKRRNYVSTYEDKECASWNHGIVIKKNMMEIPKGQNKEG